MWLVPQVFVTPPPHSPTPTLHPPSPSPRATGSLSSHSWPIRNSELMERF